MTFTWSAHYTDGTIINQVEADGRKNGYDEIDRIKLDKFTLTDEDNKEKLSLQFDGDGQKLFWTRRVYRKLTGEEQVVHLAGKRDQFVVALTTDDGVIVRHSFKEDGLFDEVIQ